MVTFADYQTLSQCFKAQYLWLDGVYLNLVRSTELVYADLYALYDYYVEIYFDQKTKEPLYINAFRDISRLDPYIEQMDISDVLETRDGFWLG